MTIWYIGTTGSDITGDGTSGNPYLTVNKCLTVGINGDTVKALNGTYNIASTINITKQFTITSDSGVNTDVIFSSGNTIFNIQESNVSITYITVQTNLNNDLITIDRMSTGTTVPTFWTGININYCNIKYVTNALSLNGTFTINNNTFTRFTGTSVANLIKVYNTRSVCSISNNSFTDAQPVQYIIYLTSMGSGTYLDMCNSKGGTLNINSNIINFTHVVQSSIFIYQNYFNQYNYVTSSNEQYNINTKLSVNSNNNIITVNTQCKLFFINTKSNSDYNMFGICNINTNTINNTDHGAVHLGKDTSSSSSLTISSDDLNRPIFKIYNNILDTIKEYFLQFDVSDTSTIFTDVAGTIPAVNINDPVNLWKTTTNSSQTITAQLNNIYGNPVPRLETFSVDKKFIKFNSTYAFYYFNANFTSIPNATLIVVMQAPGTTGSWHPFNIDNQGYYPNGSTISEAFYTNFTTPIYPIHPRYSYGNTLIYAVVANSSTLRTKCYILDTDEGLLANIANLTYSNNRITNPTSKTVGLYGGNPGVNRYGFAELSIHPYAMDESSLLSKMLFLKNKWNVGFTYTPTDPTTLILWLDASDSTTMFTDAAGTIPVTNNALVKRWNSKTANNIYLTFKDLSAGNTYTTYKTNTLNSYATILCNSSMGTYSIPRPFEGALIGGTMITVVKYDYRSNAFSGDFIQFKNTDANQRSNYYVLTKFECFGLSSPRPSFSDLNLIFWTIYVVVADPLNGKTYIYENGIKNKVYTGTYGTNIWLDSDLMFGSHDNISWGAYGSVAELYLYKGVMTTNDLDTKITSLQSKYNISLKPTTPLYNWDVSLTSSLRNSSGGQASNGQIVTTWYEKNGSSPVSDWLACSTNFGPTYDAAKQALNFTTKDRQMYITGLTNNTMSPFNKTYIFVITTPTDVASAGSLVSKGNISNTNGFITFIQSTGVLYTGAQLNATSKSFPTNTKICFAVRVPGYTQLLGKWYKNGENDTNTATIINKTAFNLTDDLVLGGLCGNDGRVITPNVTNSYCFAGKLHELLIYDGGEYSDQVIRELMKPVMEKWNISWFNDQEI